MIVSQAIRPRIERLVWTFPGRFIDMTGAEYDADYIVIGSGSGAGPLAANLALRGFKVLLLEAGDDICQTTEGRILYEVPAFHGL